MSHVSLTDRATDAPLYAEGQRERLQAMLQRGDRERALETFFRDDVGLSDADIEMMRAAPAWRSRVAAAHTIPRAFADGDYVLNPRRFEGLTVPVLLLSGGTSSPELRAATEAAHRALPNSKVLEMPGQGHVAISTAPELFARLVVEFLTEPH